MTIIELTEDNAFDFREQMGDDMAENLVFSANGSNVVMNMARGKVIYKDGEFLTLDLERIKAEVKNYAMPLVFGGDVR